DWGNKDLVWTITVHGKTEKAYATLKVDYAYAQMVYTRNEGGGTPPETDRNKPPVVKLDGDAQRLVRVGEPLSLNGLVTDDGLLKWKPAPRSAPGSEPGYDRSTGLRV